MNNEDFTFYKIKFSDWPTVNELKDLYNTEIGKFSLENWWADLIYFMSHSSRDMLRCIQIVDNCVNNKIMERTGPLNRKGQGIEELYEFVDNMKDDKQLTKNKHEILDSLCKWLSLSSDIINE